MELLLAPSNAKVSKTPYYPYNAEEGQDPWDGQHPFLSYAHDIGKTNLIPPRLRSDPDFSSLGPYDPYTEALTPTPWKELHAFYQKWLFFGLLAEFLGLNPSEDGHRIVEQSSAAAELQALYDKLIVTEGGQMYLKVDPANTFKSWGSKMISRFRGAKPDAKSRITYLRRCLNWTWVMLHSIESKPESADSRPSLDESDSIRFSIAALGELLSSGTMAALYFFKSSVHISTIPSAWSRDYLRQDGPAERRMVENGWCRTEIERLRQQYGGLNAVHYLSWLEKPDLHRHDRDHTTCTANECKAFLGKKYKPTHSVPKCDCSLMGLEETDMEEVIRILKTTETFPVLFLERKGDDDGFSLSVKPYEDGISYVAISHVWADGLGNPDKNELHSCQIERVANLVASLQQTVESSSILGRVRAFISWVRRLLSYYTGLSAWDSNAYGFWIDPLLCPLDKAWGSYSEGEMEQVHKKSLERIKDVYRKAAHVLVLDASLSPYLSKNTDPVELLLRIFGSSAWMRRLWTLQEGALAQSLYFQFADGPVRTLDLLTRVYMKIRQDSRMMRIAIDVMQETARLSSFFQQRKPGDDFNWPATDLVILQQAMYFRSVSMDSDEPYCIANLLSLSKPNVRYVLQVDAAHERMARVWKLIAERTEERFLPARLVFLVDDEKPLDLDGWRWAPRTLMKSSAPESVLDFSMQTTRFDAKGDEKHKLGRVLLVEETSGEAPTVPRCLGFKVQFPGWLLKARARCPELHRRSLHPWEGTSKPLEDRVFIRNEKTGRYMFLADLYRTQKALAWTKEEEMEYGREKGRLLCNIIDEGRCALICDPALAVGKYFTSCLLVKLEDGNDPAQTGELRVRKRRSVILGECDNATQLVAERLDSLATRAAHEQFTRDLVAVDDLESAEYKAAVDAARASMESMVMKLWNEDKDFRDAVVETQGARDQLKEAQWASIPTHHSHRVDCEELSEDQFWVVN